MGILFSLWQTFFRDEFSYSFRNVKPRSRTQNIMIWNKQIILPSQQLFHHASCRSSSYLQSWTTSFPHNWFMMIISPQKGCQLHSSCLLLSGNVLLGDNEQPGFPPKPVATENTQILGAMLKTNNGFSCSGVEVSLGLQLWTPWGFAV